MMGSVAVMPCVEKMMTAVVVIYFPLWMIINWEEVSEAQMTMVDGSSG